MSKPLPCPWCGKNLEELDTFISRDLVFGLMELLDE